MLLSGSVALKVTLGSSATRCARFLVVGGPGDLLPLLLVEDDRQAGLGQRQVTDQLGQPLLQRVIGHDLPQVRPGPAAAARPRRSRTSSSRST